ncbi:MFS transporter [Metabacillus sp. GX 13764]|uniref:MDR family MFS transporter n=1 Tax=Metabacillus kandeliae TaxID=2900151 RepID=UPI001E58C007|nr:MFS transporter [Metabacillus kandeliae]MCD7036497.1 MFS transporter [Metabacillus kandeliae]
MRIRDWDSNLKVRLMGESLMNITYWMFFPFLAIYFSEEFGKELAGLLLIVSQLFSVMANLLGGYSADRIGRKKMMVLSSCGQGIAFFTFAMASSPWFDLPVLAFIAFAVVGVFGALYWPASQAMVADVVEEKDRSDVFAIFYTSLNIAVVIGPILGGIFYVHYRFQLLLAATAVCLLLSFVLYKWTRETSPAVLAKRTMQTEKKEKWFHFLAAQIKDYGVIFKDTPFLLYILAGILAGQTFMQLDLLIPVYTKEVFGTQTFFTFGDFTSKVNGEQAYGIILSENGLLVAIFTIAVTRWMNKFREQRVFMLSSILYGGAIFWYGSVNSLWGMAAAMAVFTFAELMTAGLQQSFISRLAPEKMRGQYFAASSLRFTFSRTLAPISIPFTVWFGYQTTFALLGLLALGSAFLYYIMFKKYETARYKSMHG